MDKLLNHGCVMHFNRKGNIIQLAQVGFISLSTFNSTRLNFSEYLDREKIPNINQGNDVAAFLLLAGFDGRPKR